MRHTEYQGKRGGSGSSPAFTIPFSSRPDAEHYNDERTMTPNRGERHGEPGGGSRVGEMGTASSGGSGISDTRGTTTSGARADAAAPDSGETGNVNTSARGGRPDTVR